MADEALTPGRVGLTLAERAAISGVTTATTGPASTNTELTRAVDAVDLAGVRHCWLTLRTGERRPALLLQWRRPRPGSSWEGRVVYPTLVGDRVVLADAWVPANHLRPAG